MKTAYRVLTLNLMAFGLVAGLAACGGSDPVQPVIVQQAAPVATTPPPATGINLGSTCNVGVGQDYMQTCLIPYLQTYYGNVTIQAPVTLNGITLAAGSYGWQQIYVSFVIPVSQGCGCFMQGVPNTAGISVLGQINYSQLYASVGFSSYAMPSWAQVPVTMNNPMYPGTQFTTTFGVVFNQLITLGYQYYSSYYQAVYPNYGYYQGLGSWNMGGYYNNGFSLGGSYGNGRGLSLGFSGSFGR